MPEITSWAWKFEPGGAPDGSDPCIYAEATIDGEQVVVPIMLLEEPIYKIDPDGTEHRLESTDYWGSLVWGILQARVQPPF